MSAPSFWLQQECLLAGVVYSDNDVDEDDDDEALLALMSAKCSTATSIIRRWLEMEMEQTSPQKHQHHQHQDRASTHLQMPDACPHAHDDGSQSPLGTHAMIKADHRLITRPANQ
jgi:hypothetical protein